MGDLVAPGRPAADPTALAEAGDAAAPVSVIVREGWAVFDGEHQRHGGETVTAAAATAAAWVANGWADPISTTAESKTS